MDGPMLTSLRRGGCDAAGYDVRPAPVLDTAMLDRDAFTERLRTLITVVRDIHQAKDVLFGAWHFTTAHGLRRTLVSFTLSLRYVRCPDSDGTGAAVLHARWFNR